MTHLSLGLIGLGKWVRDAYIPILREMRQARVAAVAARTAASRDLAKREFGSHVRVHDSFQSLLSEAEVQAVAIALPNELHADAIEAAVMAGKHVFTEPPVGLNADEIARAFRALRSTNRVTQLDLELRCLPVMDLVREHLQGGFLGEPLMARVGLRCDWGYGGGPWIEEVGSQSFFLWLGCWYFDLLDCVFGVPAASVSVSGGYAMNGPIMDHGFATVVFPDHRVGLFEFNLLAMEATHITLSVSGTRGELEVDLLAGLCRSRARNQPWVESHSPCSEPVHGFAGMRESLGDFVNAILGGGRPRADLDAARRIHAIALACARAEREHNSVPVLPIPSS